MQTEALPAKHRNDRKKEALALEFVPQKVRERKKEKSSNRFIYLFILSYHIQGTHNVYLIGEKSTGKCFFRLLGWFFLFFFILYDIVIFFLSFFVVVVESCGGNMLNCNCVHKSTLLPILTVDKDSCIIKNIQNTAVNYQHLS